MTEAQQMYCKAMDLWLHGMKVHVEILENSKSSLEKEIKLLKRKLMITTDELSIAKSQIEEGTQSLEIYIKEHESTSSNS